MSSAQALHDVLIFLNSNDFKRGDAAENFHVDHEPLQIAGDAIVAKYAMLSLASRFHSLISANDERIGYKAVLTASPSVGGDYRGDIAKLALAASERQEIVYLDRLTRTLHALNYLAADLSGDLHMSVNPKHLLEVEGDHGAVFEQILFKCGLQPNRIVLEISEYAIHDKEHLQRAIDGWRKRHYRIAFDGFSFEHAQAEHVFNSKPDIVKFDARSIVFLADAVASRKAVEKTIESYRVAGIEVIATNIDNAALYAVAQTYEFTALQGSWLNEYIPDESVQKTA